MENNDILNIKKFKKETGIEGQNVKIGILDSYLDLNHPEFENRKIQSKIFEKKIDGDYHGTAITSIIGGNTIGVAPQSELFHAQVLKGDYGSAVSWANGLSYIDKRSPDIVCMSMGTKSDLSLGMKQSINKMYYKGVNFVAPVGNEGITAIRYPAKNPEFIAVGGIDEHKNISKTSNRHKKVHAYAPSENIVMAESETNQYSRITGTSFANAIFVGQIALMISYARSKGKYLNVHEFILYYNLNRRNNKKIFDMDVVKEALDIYLDL